MKERIASFRGVALLVGLALGTTFILHHFVFSLLDISPALYNSSSPWSLPWMALMLLLAVALLFIVPRPSTTWFVGLLLGGALSNTFDRQLFGPVPDYILLPGSGDLYFNLPDLLIVLGPVAFAFILLFRGPDILLPPGGALTAFAWPAADDSEEQA